MRGHRFLLAGSLILGIVGLSTFAFWHSRCPITIEIESIYKNLGPGARKLLSKFPGFAKWVWPPVPAGTGYRLWGGRSRWTPVTLLGSRGSAKHPDPVAFSR